MSDKYISEKDVSNDNDLKKKLVARVNSWANSIPHHPYKNLGNKINIKSTYYKPAYLVRVRTQFEERTKDKNHKPFTGQKIPPKKYNYLTDFNSWDLNLGKVEKFEDSSENYTVTGSQHVETCYRCHGNGSVTCPTCSGSRIIKCPNCSGSGQQRCSSCGGSGKKSCSACGGSGRRSEQVSRSRQVWVNTDSGGYYRTETYYETVSHSCNSCGGSGRVSCYTCSGRGKVTCSRCSGSGNITCTTCGGSGRVTCSTCKGNGKLMHYFYVNRNLNYTDSEQCVINADVWDNFPQFIDEYNNYEKRLLHTANGKNLSKGQLDDGHRLNKYIDKYLTEADIKKRSSKPIVMQQLDIYCIDTWEVVYSFKGKEYVMAFTGSDLEVVPGLSPIYEVAHNYHYKAIKAKKRLQYSLAGKYLAKARAIDVFEIREAVNYAVDCVTSKLNQSYKMGAVIGWLLISFFGSFVVYKYYNEVNYVLGYVDFINNPDNFLYSYHAWTQMLMSLYLIYLGYRTGYNVANSFSYSIPSAIMRAGVGLFFSVLFSLVFVIGWGLLNIIGISLIATFALWLVVKLILIIWWIIKIVIGLIYYLVIAIWGILTWLWELLF